MKNDIFRDAREAFLAKIAGRIQAERDADILDSFQEGPEPDPTHKEKLWEALSGNENKRRPRRLYILVAAVLAGALLLGCGWCVLHGMIARDSARHTDYIAAVTPVWFDYCIGIPEGFLLEEEVDLGVGKELYFANGSGDFVSLAYYDDGLNNSGDNEGVEQEARRLRSGQAAILSRKDGIWKLVWFEESRCFVLRCSVSEEFVIEVAESIQSK